MELHTFRQSLRSFATRVPFRSFVIRFVDGSELSIQHPEAVVFRGDVAYYLHLNGKPLLFDHGSVILVRDLTVNL